MAVFANIILVVLLLAVAVHGDIGVPITFMDDAVADGAVCLDGSPPAYSYLEGYGDGADSWLIYLQGGGWCTSAADCFLRSLGNYGSSLPYRGINFTFGGVLDPNQTINAVFYNWHKVDVVYCDGSSFLSNVTEPIPTKRPTYYRGLRIFDAVMKELLSTKGMSTAKNAILTGGSAGGLATYLLCDLFKSYIPSPNARVKCIADSGFFIHAKDQPGANFREEKYSSIVETHRLAESLPRSCTTKLDPSLCLFPEYFVGDIQTPLFIIDSVYDQYQIVSNLVPALGGDWTNCTNLQGCNSTELQIINDFGTSFINTLKNITRSPTRGMFVAACYTHVYTLVGNRWTYPSVFSNKTIEQAVDDWIFDRSAFQEIDTKNKFPLNCFH